MDTKKKRLTKNQKRSLRTPNAAVEHSLRNGGRIDMSDCSYAGRPPVYTAEQAGPFAPITYRKVSRGVTYVRVIKV